VRYTGIPVPELGAALVEVTKEALVKAIFEHHRKHGPRHFTVRAYDEYAGLEPDVYAERKGTPGWLADRYGAEKHQTHGGRVRPLHRSGDLRQKFLFGNMQVKATGRVALKVTATFHGLPRYTYFYNPGYVRRGARPLAHDKVAELTVMSAAEEAEMARSVQRHADQLLREREKG
jgi:hypothetical protein